MHKERHEQQMLSKEEIEAARSIDLVHMLSTLGYNVKPDGHTHWKVYEKHRPILRVTQKPGKHAVWVEWSGTSGGDAISCIRYLYGVSFREAVAMLSGHSGRANQATRTTRGEFEAPRRRNIETEKEPTEPTTPILPPWTETDRQAGRAYLSQRGIDQETMDQAETSGAIGYAKGAVLFLGRNQNNEIASIHRRGIHPNDPMPKRVLKGTDLSVPIIFPGDERHIVIAEGGTTGLAIQSLARRRNNIIPTVICIGGITQRKWINGCLPLLRKAERIEIAGEWESDPQTQTMTDKARNLMAQDITTLAGKKASISWPAKGFGDAADELKSLVSQQSEQDDMEYPVPH